MRELFGTDQAIRRKVLVECQHWILGLAVLALATVPKRKTGANAQTADLNNPNFLC